jgi:hypothetical protein
MTFCLLAAAVAVKLVVTSPTYLIDETTVLAV